MVKDAAINASYWSLLCQLQQLSAAVVVVVEGEEKEEREGETLEQHKHA
jgi:hypothetical protein